MEVAFEDLFGFCKSELIECIYKLNVPLLSAIGHQVDTTLVDHVADIVAPTPSLAAQFIVDHNKKYIEELKYKKTIYSELLRDEINDNLSELQNYKNKLILYFEYIKDYFYNNIKNDINQYKIN